MAENFCYNQNGINHILEQFGDAISNKQYKNRIPYNIYRKIRDGYQLIFISFDGSDILVKTDSATLFHTSYKDNGFGQFFYDNYVSTTKAVETKTNIKENDTMKMPTMNFDFGPFTESGIVALSPYGIAVRSSKGEYLTYNAATGATVDVTGFTFDFQKMPAAIKDLRTGDMVLHRGKPMYVQCDPPEYKDGSYFLSYDLMYAGRPYAGFAVGDTTPLACYKYVYDESKAYLKERLKYEV